MSLTGAASAQFTYDGDGRRVKSVLTTNLGATTTYFAGSHYEVTDGVVTKYYYAGATRIAMRKNGTLYYLLSDHLGSTGAVTFENGNLLSQTKYKAWGEVRHQSGPSLTEYTYTGQYSYTGSFGLMYYNARWYDPALGRFAQADSIVPPGVQGLDRYAYVNNSPMNYVDPSGHICVNNQGNDNEVAMPGGCGGGEDTNWDGGLQGPRWNNNQDSDEIDLLQQLREDPSTPLYADAFQIAFSQIMDFGVFLSAGTGWGVIVWGVGYVGNRLSASAGLYATYYQYRHNLNGVANADVWVTTISAVAGTYPPASEPVAFVQFAYDALRAGEMSPPFDIDFPVIPVVDDIP